MATFPENIQSIRQAVYGRDVREAIAESLEQTYQHYQNVEEFVDQMGVLKYVTYTIRDINGYLWGDVNGDGEANNADLNLVSRYVGGQAINPRPEGSPSWKSCVNFDESTSDITQEDQTIFSRLMAYKYSSADYIVRYRLTYDNGTSVYIWGVIPEEVIGGSDSGGGGGGGSSEYILPIATSSSLGGVMPVTKTSAMTQAVGIDAQGRLFTIPSSGGTTYTLPVASSSQLGGVMPVAKTSAMTQDVGVDSSGRLYIEPPASSGSGNGINYGTSTTAASTRSKTVTCSGFTLSTGAVIFVKFSNAQTYSATTSSPVTLNVNDTGAKSVMLYGTTIAPSGAWLAGEVKCFVYDGSNWLMLGANIPDGNGVSY